MIIHFFSVVEPPPVNVGELDKVIGHSDPLVDKQWRLSRKVLLLKHNHDGTSNRWGVYLLERDFPKTFIDDNASETAGNATDVFSQGLSSLGQLLGGSYQKKADSVAKQAAKLGNEIRKHGDKLDNAAEMMNETREENLKPTQTLRLVSEEKDSSNGLPSMIKEWVNGSNLQELDRSRFSPKIEYDYCRADGLTNPSALTAWSHKRELYFKAPKPGFTPDREPRIEESQYYNRLVNGSKDGALCKYHKI